MYQYKYVLDVSLADCLCQYSMSHMPTVCVSIVLIVVVRQEGDINRSMGSYLNRMNPLLELP